MARLSVVLLSALLSVVPASLLAASGARADWPERPLRLIVPFAAGSSSDTIARIVAAKMGDRLGQQIAVENRVGGSTVIGTQEVAERRPMATRWDLPIRPPMSSAWRSTPICRSTRFAISRPSA